MDHVADQPVCERGRVISQRAQFGEVATGPLHRGCLVASGLRRLDDVQRKTLMGAMMPVFGKLNLKGQNPIAVVDTPASFEKHLAELADVTVLRSVEDVPEAGVAFALGFGTTLRQVEAFAENVTRLAVGDAVVWFAYPKKSSKRYVCEFNRDTGWAALGAVGFEPVRQIAIDEDWSALRFRRVGHIRSMTRATRGAMTEQGRRRTSASAD